MESPPRKLNVTRHVDDRISALPDELLLRILERLSLRDAVLAGAVSTRSLVTLGIRQFRRATLVETMDAFAGALLSVCPPAERSCECQRSCAIKALSLHFYPLAPHLSSIGRAVERVVSSGKTESLEFLISLLPAEYAITQLAEFAQQFMSFSRAYQVAFRWLTNLSLKGLAFGDSDVTDLINACDKLKCLILRSCRLVDPDSALKIDAPSSGLQKLKFINFMSYAAAIPAERVLVKECNQTVEIASQFLPPKDLDSAGTSEAAHCYIQQPNGCGAFLYLS